MGRMKKSDFCMRPIVQKGVNARKHAKAPPRIRRVALYNVEPNYFSVTIAVKASSVPPRVHSMVPFSNSWVQPD